MRSLPFWGLKIKPMNLYGVGSRYTNPNLEARKNGTKYHNRQK
jgi:hypothetical protein